MEKLSAQGCLRENKENAHRTPCFTIAPGLGLPWLVASIYWEIKMPEVGFIVKAGGLEFTTSLYLVISVLGT